MHRALFLPPTLAISPGWGLGVGGWGLGAGAMSAADAHPDDGGVFHLHTLFNRMGQGEVSFYD